MAIASTENHLYHLGGAGGNADSIHGAPSYNEVGRFAVLRVKPHMKSA